MKRAYKSLRALGLKSKKLLKTDQSCRRRSHSSPPPPHSSPPRTPPQQQRRRRRPRPTRRKLEDEKKSPISTGKLASKMTKDFARLLQTIFAPWSLPGEVFSVDGARSPKNKKRRKTNNQVVRKRIM